MTLQLKHSKARGGRTDDFLALTVAPAAAAVADAPPLALAAFVVALLLLPPVALLLLLLLRWTDGRATAREDQTWLDEIIFPWKWAIPAALTSGLVVELVEFAECCC